MTDVTLSQSGSPADARALARSQIVQRAEVRICSRKDLRLLSAAIRGATRQRPILVFPLSPAPAGLELTEQEAQAVVEVAADVYLVDGPELPHELATLDGGVRLRLTNGSAWVWWPIGAGQHRSPDRFDLADQLALSRPAAQCELASLTNRLARSQRAVDDLQSALNDANADADCKDTALCIAEGCMLDAWGRLRMFSEAGFDSKDLRDVSHEDRLRWLIFREWMRLPPIDREGRSLAYVFGPDFVNSAERQAARMSETLLARTCAAIACGVGAQQLELRHVPGRTPDGQRSQLTRGDGARAWEARLPAAAPSHALCQFRLLYWAQRTGCVEFNDLTSADDSSRSSCELRRQGALGASGDGGSHRRGCYRAR
jgi:hypothetical protein